MKVESEGHVKLFHVRPQHCVMICALCTAEIYRIGCTLHLHPCSANFLQHYLAEALPKSGGHAELPI